MTLLTLSDTGVRRKNAQRKVCCHRRFHLLSIVLFRLLSRSLSSSSSNILAALEGDVCVNLHKRRKKRSRKRGRSIAAAAAAISVVLNGALLSWCSFLERTETVVKERPSENGVLRLLRMAATGRFCP